jgi:DNA-binding transcriptional regulator WhiA
MKKWTDKDIIYLQKHYQTSHVNDIAKALDRTTSSITNKVNKLGLHKETRRKYTLNIHAFSKLNIVNCYWAGFLAADGYIRDHLNHLGIRLSKKDRLHLVALANFLGYNGPIKDMAHDPSSKGNNFTSNIYYSSSLVVCGAQQLIGDLNRHFNITSRKSLKLTPPNISNVDYQLAYIAGFVDGDGTLYRDKHSRLQLSIECASEEILLWIQRIFDQIVPPQGKHHTHVRQTKRKRKNKNFSYCLKITGGRAQQICDKLLQLELPFLKRKWSNVV